MVKKTAIESKSQTTVSDSSKSIKKRNLSKRFNKLRVKPADLQKKGVVYVGHLPKGFNEQELKKFFEQFGNVAKYRVSRSKKVSLTLDLILIYRLEDQEAMLT